MPNLRTLLLKKIFGEGVDSVPKSTLDYVFKRMPEEGKLYRYEENTKRLLDKGFQLELHATEKYSDTPGLYFTDDPKYYYFNEESLPRNIEAIRRPGSKLLKRDSLFEEEDSTQHLLKDYDFAKRGREVIQLKPNNTLAKIGNKYKILGLAGALGLGANALPDEAEASPLGKFWKAGSKSIVKSLEKPATRSSDVLAGFDLPGKGVIKEVRGASGSPWRDVHFEDGTMQVMTKDYVAELARTAGTDKYMTRYQSAQYKKKVDQALTSLQGHRDRYSGHTPRELRDLESVKVTKGRELKVATPERIFVKDLGIGSPRDKGQVYMMLKPYAELLEKKGYVQIGDQKILKGFYDGWEKMQMPDAFKVVKPKE